MELTLKQQEAVNLALKKWKNGDKYITISGYAGTGKSTTVRFIIDALQINPDDVAYAAFTGKAAEVLRKKGCPNACTLHKLLYDHYPKPNGGFFRKPKDFLEYRLVVVDEISMAPKSMLDMLLRHNVFCIFLGDPFQLPQISKEDAHDFLDHPHVFLDEIMRQAAESEIIRLTMAIREGKPIPHQKGEEAIVTSKKNLTTGMLTWADNIICATNATRHNINNQMRQILGYTGNIPQDGEKIIIKRNYWDDINADGDSLVNGIICQVENSFESFVRIPSWIKNNRRDLPIVTCNLIPEVGTPFENVSLDKDFLLTEQPCVDWKVAYQIGKAKKRVGDILPRQGTWGYAVTCHSSQGSEWDKVLVIEESFPFDRKEHARWLYTAATRAASKLVLVRK